MSDYEAHDPNQGAAETQNQGQNPGQGGFPGYPPAYNQGQYPQQYPQQQPPPGYGYPPPGYGYPPGYGPPPGQRSRPGLATAASVLSFVNAGLLVIGGSLLLFGANIVSGVESGFGSSSNLSSELLLDGFVNLLCAGLLIAGGVQVLGRKRNGRILMTVGAGIVLAACVYWLVRFNDVTQSGGLVVYSLLFGVLAVLSLAFISSSSVRTWIGPG